jgi:predicted N-acyltransferase
VIFSAPRLNPVPIKSLFTSSDHLAKMTAPPKVTYSVRWLDCLSSIPQASWDDLALRLRTPFLEWQWLTLMETSQSAVIHTGWLPRHLTVWAGKQLVGAAPLYIKGHSAGEFVFDHAWAEVAARLEVAYYPKLVGMSPFTPMIGYRFLIAPGENEQAVTGLMVAEIERFCRRFRLSGCSFLFVDPQWRPTMEGFGFTSWQHQSFVWENQGYHSFQDYLGRFNANQRRNIKRERTSIERQGILLKPFWNREIPRTLVPEMFRFYERHNDKFGPWGCKYLTGSFFEGLYQRYRDRLLIVAAFERNDCTVPVGMSLLISKGDQLFGRYWGCVREFKDLHFNACYYSPIEWAIQQGVQRFDPGMGGQHKIRRGFTSIPNFSLHRFYDPRMQQILRLHIDRINSMEQSEIDAMNAQLPFAQSDT